MIHHRLCSIQLVVNEIQPVLSNNGSSNIEIIHVNPNERNSFSDQISSSLDPKESDRQELMKQTDMSAAQITIWFTNARVKMRKEKKLSIQTQNKKKKRKSIDSFDELFSLIDDLFPCTTPPSKQYVIVHSCLTAEQTVGHQIESFTDHSRFHFR